MFTGQPSWLVIFCLLLAGIYAFTLYFREKKNEFPVYLKIVLGIGRFFVVFLISFLLLSPFIRKITKEKEKPLVIVAMDNSQSILLNADSNLYKSEFPALADRLAEKLSSAVEVRRYAFGDQLRQLGPEQNFAGRMNFTDRSTDISGMFGELKNLYANLNVGALILVSDGIYNTGANPVYQSGEWQHPVYTIALGDTSVRKDLIISGVNFNRMVYLNNKFPLEIVVRALDLKGEKSRLNITQEGKLLYSGEIDISDEEFTQSYPIILDAKKTGLQKYTITLVPLEDELSTLNNRKDIFIDVLDGKSRVLILSAAPHPDISALSQAISANMNYEVDEKLLVDFNDNVEKFSMVILHHLPSADFPAETLLRNLSDKKIPVLYILGMKSDLNRFNQWKSGLHIASSPEIMFDEAVPVINPGFATFSLSDETRSWLADLPPLISPLGEYQVPNSARILVTQRIGSVETSRPLIVFDETLDGRSGVIAGEGIWKWRLFNYARSKNHDAFNELVNKIVQYLSLKEQKKNFRIYHAGNFSENEPVIFDAEVYNDNYELTTEPEVSITITNEEAKQFPFVFNKAGNAYHLDAGVFPPGNYSYTAQTTLGNRNLSANGQFSVSAIDLEALNTVADHHLLYQIAAENGGKLFYPAQIEQLSEELLDRDDIRPVAYSRKTYEDLLNNGWIFLLILALLTAEWFLRKRAGGY